MTEHEVLFALFKMAELGALQKFERNCKKERSSPYLVSKNNEYSGVLGSFNWSATPEGHSYWEQISDLVD